MKRNSLPVLIAAAAAFGITNRHPFPDINFRPIKAKCNQRQRCNDYSPESPEVVAMTKRFNQKKGK